MFTEARSAVQSRVTERVRDPLKEIGRAHV